MTLALIRQTGLSGQADRPRATPSFTSTTTAILVDMVVRDRSGRPVVDLSAGDFAVAEDGIGQKAIRSPVSRVAGASASTSPGNRRTGRIAVSPEVEDEQPHPRQARRENPRERRRPYNPLLVRDVVISPNLGDPVSKKSKEVGFYFAAYPAQGKPAPEAMIELLQNGKPVAQIPMPLPAADASGRIQQVGRLPIGELAPGNYELRAVVAQGSDQIARSSVLRIVE